MNTLCSQEVIVLYWPHNEPISQVVKDSQHELFQNAVGKNDTKEKEENKKITITDAAGVTIKEIDSLTQAEKINVNRKNYGLEV